MLTRKRTNSFHKDQDKAMKGLFNYYRNRRNSTETSHKRTTTQPVSQTHPVGSHYGHLIGSIIAYITY